MNFFRIFIVVFLITLCGGVFGAIVGGLVGFAGPNSVAVFFGMKKHQVVDDVHERSAPGHDDQSVMGPHAPPEIEHRAEFGISPRHDAPLAPYGAALGCAAGLVFGAIAGICLAALDQIILLIRKPSQAITLPPATGPRT